MLSPLSSRVDVRWINELRFLATGILTSYISAAHLNLLKEKGLCTCIILCGKMTTFTLERSALRVKEHKKVNLCENCEKHIGIEWDWHCLREKLFCPKDDHLQPCLNRCTAARLLGSYIPHQCPARHDKTSAESDLEPHRHKISASPLQKYAFILKNC